MLTTLNTSKWYDNLWAALIFYTRLPLLRIHKPPRQSYQSVTEYWPFVGWLTGGITATTIFFGHNLMPYSVTLIIAIAIRLLLTGAIHEFGLCGFLAGISEKGNDRNHILTVIKDSHTTRYGMIGFIIYELLLITSLYSIPPTTAAFIVLAADPFAKMVAGQIIMMLPYASTEKGQNVKTKYRKPNLRGGIGMAIHGLLPIIIFIYTMQEQIEWQHLIFMPCLVMYGLYLIIYKRLHGYTEECNGAIFLLVELTVYITASYSNI